MRSPALLPLLALVALAGCASPSPSAEPSARDEASLSTPPVTVEVTHTDGTKHLHLTHGVLPIERVVQPRVGLHMRSSGRYACGARLELPPGHAWSVGVLESKLKATPARHVEPFASGARSGLVFESQPVAAWDSAILLETRDGRPFADVVREAIGDVGSAGLGTLSIELCPGVAPEKDEARFQDPDVVAIEKLTEPEATVHLTMPGSFECGFRVQISDEASVGWNFFLLPQLVEVLGERARVDLDFEGKALTVTLVDATPAWDIWMTIKTRDGRSLADVIRQSVNAAPGEPLGTIGPTRCQ